MAPTRPSLIAFPPPSRGFFTAQVYHRPYHRGVYHRPRGIAAVLLGDSVRWVFALFVIFVIFHSLIERSIRSPLSLSPIPQHHQVCRGKTVNHCCQPWPSDPNALNIIKSRWVNFLSIFLSWIELNGISLCYYSLTVCLSPLHANRNNSHAAHHLSCVIVAVPYGVRQVSVWQLPLLVPVSPSALFYSFPFS